MVNLASHSISALAILALAHVPVLVLAQNTPSSEASLPTDPTSASATATTTDTPTAEPTSETTATTLSTTVTPSATTVDSTTTTTLSLTPSATTTTTDPIPTLTTVPTRTIPTTTRSWNPTNNHSTITSTTTAAPLPTKSDNGSSSSSSTNVPVIVGTVVGIVALAVIVATSVICYRRRRRRNNQDLTFDALTGMSGPSQSSKTRAGSGAIGLNSMTSGGYDDPYDYEMQSNSGYTPEQNAAFGYNNGGYDGYAASSPHQGYHLASPTIFQEDHYVPMAAPFATASSMDRTRDGFDQNLPEVMYNGGMEDPATAAMAAGYYNESDMYNQSGWHQDTRQTDGYTGHQGLQVVNPGNQYHHHQNAAHGELDYHGYTSADPTPTSQYQERTMPVAMTLDPSRVESPSKSSDYHGSNANTLPDSPILQSSTLRGGDLFGQDGETNVGSPRSTAREVGSSGSPKVVNARDTSRSSVEGGNSYANDYMKHPSVDGRGSRPTSPTNLNPNKTLRTLRPDDWS